MDLFQIDKISWALLMGLGLVWLIQVIYYLFVFLSVFRKKKRQKKMQKNETAHEPLSVIVYAHNDAETLSVYLPFILEQDYDTFEVIVVDNASRDDTQSVLQVLQQQYDHLRFTEIKNEVAFVNAKYFALTVGVKSAQYDRLLFTEAHCKPVGLHWLSSMQSVFSESKDVVLGYTRYAFKPGRLNRWIRYDHFYQAIQRFGHALSAKPYTGFGNNIGYRKSLFFKHNGFMHLAHLPIGNEPLYVDEVAHRRTTAVMLLPDAYVEEEAATSFRSWLRSRKQHTYASTHFSFLTHIRTNLEMISRLLFYGMVVFMLLFDFRTWMVVAGLFLLRLILQLCILIPLQFCLGERKLWWTIPWYDLGQPIFLLMVIFAKIFTKHRNGYAY